MDNGPEPNDVTSLQGNKETCALEDFKHSKQPLTNAKGSLVLLHKFYTWYKSQTECFFFFLEYNYNSSHIFRKQFCKI